MPGWTVSVHYYHHEHHDHHDHHGHNICIIIVSITMISSRNISIPRALVPQLISYSRRRCLASSSLLAKCSQTPVHNPRHVFQKARWFILIPGIFGTSVSERRQLIRQTRPRQEEIGVEEEKGEAEKKATRPRQRAA